MYSATLGQHINLVPGLHNLSRTQGLRTTKRAAQGQDALQDALKRLEHLSPAERKILSTESTKVLSGLLGLEKSSLKSQQFDWDAAFKFAVESVRGGDVSFNQQKNSFVVSQNFLQAPSPLLVNARGFKTRIRTGTTDKAFIKQPKSGVTNNNDESFGEVLKQLNISQSEKEKVNIALTMAANAKKEEGETESEKTSDKKKTWNFRDRRVASRGVWDRLQKFATLLIITSCLIGLYQVFGLNLKLSRNSNEISPEDIEVNFDDVRGCDEAKRELQDVVEFLMNPDKFSALGGRLPKGVLLVGPPGTGKTLLARAVAGQAGVPFFQTSGSEFDEVLVGQGARRVRDLFKSAKEKAPCVIFIDEIDSVGGKRSTSSLHPYANQTINQLLSEMDGFVSNEGVIVLGATNRSDDLDKALLRPGRFDTQVEVNNPDVKGRTEILELYMGKIKHDNSIDVEILAKKSMGFSGADLQNLVNTAAIRAAIDGKEWVTMTDFDYAYDKLTIGVDLKSRVRGKEDLTITAYHEAGHTLVAYFTPDASPLHKVTIVAKGGSGGHTAFIPKESAEWHQTKAQLKARMDTGMGGRAAEELIFGKEKITGGASSDLQMVTKISVNMVTELGMSEKFGNRILHDNKYNSSNTKEMVDGEIKLNLEDSYKRAMNILTTHKNELHMLAEALLKYETLDADDIKSIIEHKRPPSSKLSQASSLLGLKPGLANQLPPVSTIPGLGVPIPNEALGSRKEPGSA